MERGSSLANLEVRHVEHQVMKSTRGAVPSMSFDLTAQEVGLKVAALVQRVIPLLKNARPASEHGSGAYGL
jgi:hypothetical protein